MTWISASLILFFSSVLVYLFIRKSQELKTDNLINNLALFLIPCFGYLIIILSQHLSLILNYWHLILILFSAYFFSYLGNVFSLKSLQLAPNPGYSLIISKSYVVFTSVVSIFLFNSELTLKSIISILLIIAFSGLIVIERPSAHKQTLSQAWLIYAIGSFFAWGFLALMSKYLIDQGVNILARLFYLTLFVSLIFLLDVKKKSLKFSLTKIQWQTLILMGILSFIFNYCQQLGYQLGHNPGYINAVNASSISLLTLLSAYFFHDELNLRKLIGIFGVTAGLILLLV